MKWDATIDLGCGHLQPGVITPGEAVEQVRAAVSRLPGAGWVSVGWFGDLPATQWIRVYRPGNCLEPEGSEWDVLRNWIKATVNAVLA
jgi:hypothetical protein